MMNKPIRLYMGLLCLIASMPACFERTSEQKEEQEQLFYDLNDSTEIILNVLKEGTLSKLLEDADPEGIDTLIKNVSPALMAFEAEVLSCVDPVLVCFYGEGQRNECREMIEQLHEQSAHIKYVLVDVEKLFSVAKESDVETTPQLLLVNNGEEIDRFVPPFDSDALVKKLAVPFY